MQALFSILLTRKATRLIWLRIAIEGVRVHGVNY